MSLKLTAEEITQLAAGEEITMTVSKAVQGKLKGVQIIDIQMVPIVPSQALSSNDERHAPTSGPIQQGQHQPHGTIGSTLKVN